MPYSGVLPIPLHSSLGSRGSLKQPAAERLVIITEKVNVTMNFHPFPFVIKIKGVSLPLGFLQVLALISLQDTAPYNF